MTTIIPTTKTPQWADEIGAWRPALPIDHPRVADRLVARNIGAVYISAFQSQMADGTVIDDCIQAHVNVTIGEEEDITTYEIAAGLMQLAHDAAAAAALLRQWEVREIEQYAPDFDLDGSWSSGAKIGVFSVGFSQAVDATLRDCNIDTVSPEIANAHSLDELISDADGTALDALRVAAFLRSFKLPSDRAEAATRGSA